MNKHTLKQLLQNRKRQLTQQELARQYGVSQSLISLIINGKRKNTKIEREIRNAVTR